MFFVYVLRSLKSGRIYVGSTGRDIQIRLHEHNSGQTIATNGKGPYKLIYSEAFESELIAKKREHFLKTGKGREALKKLL